MSTTIRLITRNEVFSLCREWTIWHWIKTKRKLEEGLLRFSCPWLSLALSRTCPSTPSISWALLKRHPFKMSRNSFSYKPFDRGMRCSSHVASYSIDQRFAWLYFHAEQIVFNHSVMCSASCLWLAVIYFDISGLALRWRWNETLLFGVLSC